MEEIEDYNALEELERTEGREVLVLYTNLIYRLAHGELVGRLDTFRQDSRQS